MSKIFLDLGLHNGQTLKIAMDKYPEMDKYIGVEPVPSLYQIAVKSLPQETYVVLYNFALDDLKGKPRDFTTFYEDMNKHNNKLGSSLLPDKTIKQKKAIEVSVVDVNYFFKQNFKNDDEVILKIDVEGKEYDIFDALIESGELKRVVKKIYAEWHFHKVKSISKERHDTIVMKLNKLGYKLTGDSKKDEFYCGK
jgi:FkbM family methyltransferase